MEIDAGALPPPSQLHSQDTVAKRTGPRPCAACPFRAEIFEARTQAGYWKDCHQRARKREDELQEKVEQLEAKIKELERQLFGRRSEKGCGDSPKTDGASTQRRRRRGQQPGRPGPGRRDTSHLPSQEEFHALAEDQCRCDRCGLAFEEFAGTEDSEVLEIEVRGYKRKIRRRRYRPTCQCEHLPGIVTAPGPAKLIPKGRLGVSLWVEILLDKYAFLRPTQRLLSDLRTYGIDLSPGAVTGGLKKLVPVFEPIRDEIVDKNLEQLMWHADETSWPVFVPVEGKVGWKWKFWVFQSPSAVVFVLDPTREARVPETYFEGIEGGTLIVDRYSGYKAMKQVKAAQILLAFCWAHVRRDFLGVGRHWPGHKEWGLSWVETIGEVFHLNAKRLQAPSQQFEKHDEILRNAVDKIAKRREEEISDPTLHPVRRKPLVSLAKHWDGLTRFVDHPEIPMDNNTAERTLRALVCGRKQFSGSRAKWAGQLAAHLFSLFATLQLWAINPRQWLTEYLQACAQAGGQAPPDAARWLPWNLPLSERTAMAEWPQVEDTS
jgi:transposase